MKILAIDKNISRHDNIRSLLTNQFPKAVVNLVAKLENHAEELSTYSLVLIHVGNSADYTIIFKTKPVKNIIYYTGSLEMLEQDEDGIWSPYDDLHSAVKLVGIQ